MTTDRRFSRISKRRALWVLLLLLVANTLSNADRHVFSVLIPAIKGEFGVSDSVMGLIAGPGFFLSYVLFSLPLARVADRWSRTGVISISVAVWSVAAAMCGMAGNVVQLAIARVTVGVGEAGGFPPAQSLVGDLFEKTRRSGALGILTSGTHLGLVLGLAGGAAIGEFWGWRAAFLTLALPGLPVALLIWWSSPRRAKPAPLSQPRPTESVWAVLKMCWRIRSLRLVALAMGVYNIFGYAGAIWLPAYFMRSHGMSMLEAGSWLGLGASLGGIAGSVAAGRLVDRLTPSDMRWQLRVPGIAFLLSFPLLVVMLSIPSGAALTLPFARVPLVALLCVITGFLAAAWAAPVYGAIALTVPPEQRGQAAAVLAIVINVLGSVCGPVIAGLVSDLLTGFYGTEALRYSLSFMTILTLIGSLLFLRAARWFPGDVLPIAPQP